jgi:ABC-2 type transport system ATP-binding protein
MVDIVTTLEGTVLFSSHVMEDVVETADRVIVLHHGRIVFDGDTRRLQSLAPESTAPSRRAEAAFLRLLGSSESLRT